MNDKEVEIYIAERGMDAGDNVVGICPICGNVIYEWETKCDICGQKLKWEE